MYVSFCGSVKFVCTSTYIRLLLSAFFLLIGKPGGGRGQGAQGVVCLIDAPSAWVWEGEVGGGGLICSCDEGACMKDYYCGCALGLLLLYE